ncbi:MAG: carboxypeptidase-like regulatory domain-containing protein [Bacteroidetes bacterium]|nr:carboxypeptidase-like regulatory domain-containing protein [Bacteroidota bacterium]
MTSVNVFGASSSIEGSVKDSQTGEPLPGATVLLVGTSMGAATDLNGNFTIRDVPPGEYRLPNASCYGKRTLKSYERSSWRDRQDFLYHDMYRNDDKCKCVRRVLKY